MSKNTKRKQTDSDHSVGSNTLDNTQMSDCVLERFTDPVKKKKKKHKQAQHLKAQQTKNIMRGKELAQHHFNTPFTQTYIDLIQNEIDKPQSIECLQAYVVNAKVEDIKYVSVASKDGLVCVFNFIACASFCKSWLKIQLKNIGWQNNMTNYNPIAVSHSPPELLSATIECFKMACKQMIRYLHFSNTPKT